MILSGNEEGRYTLVEAAERMGVSYRQAKGIWYRYHKEYVDINILFIM